MCCLGQNLPGERSKCAYHILKADGGAVQGKGSMAASGRQVLSVYGIVHLGPGLRVSTSFCLCMCVMKVQKKM